MSLSKILKLGDPRLHEVSVEVKQEEIPSLQDDIQIMHNALMEFRELYGAGRAVAAPQIGVFKRFIYFNLDKPIVLYNPVLKNLSKEKIIVWDDCLSFPGLLIKVERHKSLDVHFKDENWNDQVRQLEGDLAELIQHENDHLNGIVATQKAMDEKSFRLINP